MSTNLPLFDPRRVKLRAAHAAPGALFALCLDDSSRTLFGAGTDGAVYAVNLADDGPAAVRRWTLHDNYVSGLIHLDGQLISCGFDRQLIWTDAATGRRVRALTAHDGWVRRLVATPDGKRLVTIGDDMCLKVWDAAGRAIHSLLGHAAKTPEGYLSALYGLAVSPDGNHAASADRAGFVRVWDLARGTTAAEFRAPEFYTFDAAKRARGIGGIRGLAFSADGNRLAVSGIGVVTNVDGFVGPCRLELWDWKAARRISHGQDNHQAILNHVAFGPTYTWLNSWLIGAGGGDGGGALVFWQADSGEPPTVVKPRGHLHAFVINRSGDELYAAGHQGFQIWQLNDRA